MTDGQGNRRKPHFRQGEIEAQAIEALERARLLPPGDKRHELLKAAGKLRMQVVVERLSGETLAVSPKPTPRPANRRRNKT